MATYYPAALIKNVSNHGGAMSAHLGLVLHVQEGNGGLSGWFNNPSSSASSTWWVSKTGIVEQYVDADLQAWAQASGNSTYNSVETEGYTTEPLTAQQIDALAALYTWGNRTFGWPYVESNTVGNKGFAWHGMGGAAWGNHPGCPGDLRKNARPTILQKAGGAPTPTPPPSTPQGDPLMVMIQATGQPGIYMYDGLAKRTIMDTTSVTAYRNAGIQTAVVTAQELAAIPNA
jgi:hypothetical protein